jgi:hypothetical protein
MQMIKDRQRQRNVIFYGVVDPENVLPVNLFDAMRPGQTL